MCVAGLTSDASLGAWRAAEGGVVAGRFMPRRGATIEATERVTAI
jgi:hypothetical protein